jgi:hypothetical protein
MLSTFNLVGWRFRSVSRWIFRRQFHRRGPGHLVVSSDLRAFVRLVGACSVVVRPLRKSHSRKGDRDIDSKLEAVSDDGGRKAMSMCRADHDADEKFVEGTLSSDRSMETGQLSVILVVGWDADVDGASTLVCWKSAMSLMSLAVGKAKLPPFTQISRIDSSCTCNVPTRLNRWPEYYLFPDIQHGQSFLQISQTAGTNNLSGSNEGEALLNHVLDLL